MRTLSQKAKIDVALVLGSLALALIVIGLMGMTEHIELSQV